MPGPPRRRLSLGWLALPVVLVPLGWLLFAGLGRDPREIPSPLIGHPLPTLEAMTLDGDAFASASVAGHPIVVNIWASWCTPCIDEHAVLLDAADAHPELHVVGVIYQDTADGARRFLARYGDGGWPNLLDDNGRIAIDLGVTGPPETVFVDARGIVRARHIGPLTADVMATLLSGIGVSP